MAIHTSCGFDVFWFVVGFSDLVEYCTIHFIFRVRARTMGCSPRNLDRLSDPHLANSVPPAERVTFFCFSQHRMKKILTSLSKFSLFVSEVETRNINDKPNNTAEYSYGVAAACLQLHRNQ